MNSSRLPRAEVGPLPHHPMIPHLPEKEPQKEQQSAPQNAPLPATLIYLPERRNWQYKIASYTLPHDALPSESDLAELGAEGWELVTAVPLDNVVHFYFKRF